MCPWFWMGDMGVRYHLFPSRSGLSQPAAAPRAGPPAAEGEGARRSTAARDMALLAALAARAPALAAVDGLEAALDALLGWALRGGGGGAPSGDLPRVPSLGSGLGVAPARAPTAVPPAAASPLAREAVQLGGALLCAYRCGRALKSSSCAEKSAVTLPYRIALHMHLGNNHVQISLPSPCTCGSAWMLMVVKCWV